MSALFNLVGAICTDPRMARAALTDDLSDLAYREAFDKVIAEFDTTPRVTPPVSPTQPNSGD